MSASGVIRGLFFDLDGTLADTDEANYHAYSRAFADEGYTLDRKPFFYLQSTLGLRADAYIPRLAPDASPEVVNRIWKNKAGYYANAMHLVRPNHQLIAFLRLSRPHHTTALLTTAKRANASRVLAATGLSLNEFDHHIFGDEVTQSKPNPEVYLKALERADLEPNEVIAFEDSEGGLAAANAAGIRVIKVVIP